jgi:hypothetical protein
MLTSSELTQLRSIYRFMPVLWALLRFDRPLTESEIAGIYKMNIETVRSHLRSLSREGLVIRLGRYQGWALTNGGSQLLLPYHIPAQVPSPGFDPLPEPDPLDPPGSERGKPALKIKNPSAICPGDIPPTRIIRAEDESERGNPALDTESTPQALGLGDPRTPKIHVENESERGKPALDLESDSHPPHLASPRTRKIRAENEHERGKTALDIPKTAQTRKIRAQNKHDRGKSALEPPLEEEDLNLKNLDLESSSSSDLLPPNLDVREIQKAVRELFGEPLTGSSERYKDPHRLLAWIASAYDNRAGLRHPSRVVYRSYHNPGEPEDCYRDRPEDFLPDWFLARLGLLEPDSEGDDCGDSEDPEDPEDPCDPLPENPNLSPQVAHWWSACCEHLNYQLGAPKFNDWIRDLRPWDWDPEISLLTLVAPTAYNRDCVESRLKATIQRILVGIANRAITVRITTHPPQ